VAGAAACPAMPLKRNSIATFMSLLAALQDIQDEAMRIALC
jgi:hypothetical protein